MTDPIDKYDEHRAAALAKVERRIEREIAAIEGVGLDPALATVAEIIASGVELSNDLDGVYSPRQHTNDF